MTSERKIAANRRNAIRSTGPRSDHAKARTRRNALRHGLAVISLRDPSFSAEAHRLTSVICGKDANSTKREQALVLAENELMLLKVRAARISVMQRIFSSAPEMKLGSGTERETLIKAKEYAGAYSVAIKQLTRLDRYERVALARRTRAIRALDLT
jgi:hypothetical protein